ALGEAPSQALVRLRARARNGRQSEKLTVESIDRAAIGVEQPDGATADRVEDGLEVGRCDRDHVENFARRLLTLQALLQALLQVADPSALVLGRLVGRRGLRLDLGLRGLWTPAHRPPLGACE